MKYELSEKRIRLPTHTHTLTDKQTPKDVHRETEAASES